MIRVKITTDGLNLDLLFKDADAYSDSQYDIKGLLKQVEKLELESSLVTTSHE